jgi:hypothetical protein
MRYLSATLFTKSANESDEVGATKAFSIKVAMSTFTSKPSANDSLPASGTINFFHLLPHGNRIPAHIGDWR